MKKGGFLRNVLDTIRPNQQQQPGGPAGSGMLECGGQLRPQHFALGQVARHGFPSQPSALAYDPVQRIAAIGTSTGALRVFGRPGVEAWAQHKPECTVTHIQFIVNQGALVTVTADEGLHLWSLRGPQLKLQFSATGSGVLVPSPIPAAQPPTTTKQQSFADSSDFLAYDHRSSSTDLNNDNNGANNYNCNNSKQLQILHTLKFKREHITCLHQTLMSKWLYVGTERGNVHVVNVETFQLSGYSISWNKAIELARKTHPGAIIHLSESPQDTNKLLIGYQSGCISLWDLKNRTATCRYFHLDQLQWLSWLHDGKQFVAAHNDGSLVIWQARSGIRPSQVFFPHAKRSNLIVVGEQQQPSPISHNATNEVYGPITKVEWRNSPRTNEPLLLFSGGLPEDEDRTTFAKQNTSQDTRPTSLTVMLGKSITVLELEQPIVDFITISESSPYENESSEPTATFVLLDNELLIIDLQTPGYPSFKSPYPGAKLSESPVTCIKYLADCSPDLISLLCSGLADDQSSYCASKRGFSEREWPIAGGEWESAPLQGYPELVITGHADGSLKFWDMSGLNLDLLANLKSANLFEEPDWPSSIVMDSTRGEDEEFHLKETPFSISRIEFCSTGSRLLVAGALGQVVQFRLIDQRRTTVGASQSSELAPVILVGPTTGDLSISLGNQQNKQAMSRSHLVLKARRTQQTSSSSSSATSKLATTSSSASQRSKPNAFQPELICLSSLRPAAAGGGCSLASYRPPPMVTALAYESIHSILAYAHEDGIVLVDVIQKSVIISAPLADLYGGGSLMAQDVSIQPFATSSILQQHYHQQEASSLPLSSSTASNAASTMGSSAGNNQTTAWGHNCTNADTAAQHNNEPNSGYNGLRGNGGKLTRAGDSRAAFDNNRKSAGLHDGGPANESGQQKQSQRQLPRSEPTSVFQRQLSTTALRSEQATTSSTATRDSSMPSARLIQRQMTASQLLSSHESPSNKQRTAALLAAARGQSGGLESALANSTSCLSGGSGSGSPLTTTARGGQAGHYLSRRQPTLEADDPTQNRKSLTKGKRIISRMLSISTIHSSLGSSGLGSGSPDCGSNTTSMDDATSIANKDEVPDKIDSSFTRSRSSSCSSDTSPRAQEPQLSIGESIQCLCFLDWTRETNSLVASSGDQGPSNNKSFGSIDGSTQAYQLALWLGTSQGSVLLLGLTMPDNDDNRILQLQSVDAEPIPQATIKLGGSIRCLSTFASEFLAARSTPSTSSQTPSSPLVKSASSSLEAAESPITSIESRGKSPIGASGRPKSAQPLQATETIASEQRPSPTFLAIVSERQVRILQVSDYMVTLPTSSSTNGASGKAKLRVGETNCVARANFAAPVHSAALMQMRQPFESCLATQLATGGQLLVHSLPQLKLLLESQLDPPPARGSVVFGGSNGHALYQPSPSEIAKFTFNAQYKISVGNMSSYLYVAREMPELPRSNFFKSLLGSVGTSLTSKQCDRDELFGGGVAAADNKAQGSRAIAKHIGTSGLDRLRGAATGGLGSEIRQAREGLDERGEKLSEIEDRTLLMMNQSETYSQTSHQLAQKFKDKKWYQF